MSEQLYWPRLEALLRNDAIGEYRHWLIASAAIAGVLLIGAVIAVQGGPSGPYYRTAFFAILFVLGTIRSSTAFAELHDKSKNTAYLLLPASALEKTLAPLLKTTVVFIGYSLVFTALASAAIEGINWLVYRRTNDLFDPFEREIWTVLSHYVVLQSFFFVGAAWFRSAHYVKTLLAVVLACFALAALSLLASLVAGVARITSNGVEVQADFGFDFLFLPDSSVGAAVRIVLAILWFVALPVFCWFVAWLRVAETQVSHGV